MRRTSVPFTPVLRGAADEAKQAAEQLNQLITHYEGQGWSFVQLESVTSVRPAGCLGFGQSTTHIVQVAVFEQRQ